MNPNLEVLEPRFSSTSFQGPTPLVAEANSNKIATKIEGLGKVNILRALEQKVTPIKLVKLYVRLYNDDVEKEEPLKK